MGEQSAAVSMAISCMWAWMVPRFYIEFIEYRLALSRASLDLEDDSNGGNPNAATKETTFETARSAALKGLCWSIGIIGIVYSISAVVISRLTAQPDAIGITEPDVMAIGVGRILSAIILVCFSVEFPKWLGISYSSRTFVECYKQLVLVSDCESASTEAEGCNKKKNSHVELSFRVSWSILGHFFLFYPFLPVYFCNQSTVHIALSTLVGIFCGFSVIFVLWLGHTMLSHKKRIVFAISLSLPVALISSWAFSSGCWYVREVWSADSTETTTPDYTAAKVLAWLVLCLLSHGISIHWTMRKVADHKVAKEALQEQQRLTTSHDASPVESIQGEWRYTSKVFQPPKAITHVATKLIASVSFFRKTRQKPPQKKELDPQNSDHVNTQRDGNTTITSVNPKFDSESHKQNESTEDEAITDQKQNHGNDESLVISIDHPVNSDSIVETKGDEILSARPIDKREIPSFWFMIRSNSCCRRQKHYHAPRKKGWSMLATVVKWILWILVCAWHVSFTIVSIGANLQRQRVLRTLSGTFEMLYPENYTTGAMCAWSEASPSGDIRTFYFLQDVIDEGYSVIHCGECGKCSNWNDLSIQWTTRDHLAQTAKNCVTKSILGSREDVQTCNEESIGFTEECALCWTEDEYCARNNCMFLFLQSVFTNQMNNFNVGPDDITPATCDEALCGPEFVPCSGATRRRMNIVSDIPRPISQQCGVAEEDWSLVFDHP